MRENLKNLHNLRKIFIGTFVRYGTKTGWKGRTELTILLKDIKFSFGETILTDHLWFSCGKQFSIFALKEGDIVQFSARCTEYVKGYKGNRYSDDDYYLNEHPIEKDYRLSHPNQVKLVKRNNPLSPSVPMESA